MMFLSVWWPFWCLQDLFEEKPLFLEGKYWFSVNFRELHTWGMGLTFKGPFAQMCINIHRCRWLSWHFALEMGTKGLRGSYGAENWWKDTWILSNYGKTNKNIFSNFFHFFFGLNILKFLKIWGFPQNLRILGIFHCIFFRESPKSWDFVEIPKFSIISKCRDRKKK